MAEVYTAPFTVTLSSAYTAGNSTISVSGAAPVAIQSGTFRVRLANTSNTVLKVTSGASTTTWSVTAEFNDANAVSGATVYGCEFSPGALTQLRADWLGIDAPPLTAGSLDDEFNGSVLDTSRWTWANQGTTATTVANGALGLVSPAESGSHWRYIYQTAPATPWEVTAKIGVYAHGTNYAQAGLILGDATSKLVTFAYGWINGYGMNVTEYSDWNNGVVSVGGTGTLPPRYLRIKDDGTNLTFSLSILGTAWRQVYQAARTFYLASGPTKIGLAVDSENSQIVTLECDWFRRTI